MATSKRIPSRVGMIPELPKIIIAEGGLTNQQIAVIADTLRNIIRAINGRLTFGDGTRSGHSGNIDGQIKEVTFVSANTNYEVPHGLGRVPIGIIVLSADADGAVVRSADLDNWGVTTLYVRCNVAGTTARFVVV